jgi:hypothetical protein
MMRIPRTGPTLGTLASLLLGATSCSTVSPAQSARNNALWEAGRACENGSLRVERVSNEGVIHTRTMNSSGHEFAPFERCYNEKATPIWRSYCQAEPDSPQCRR